MADSLLFLRGGPEPGTLLPSLAAAAAMPRLPAAPPLSALLAATDEGPGVAEWECCLPGPLPLRAAGLACDWAWLLAALLPAAGVTWPGVAAALAAKVRPDRLGGALCVTGLAGSPLCPGPDVKCCPAGASTPPRALLDLPATIAETHGRLCTSRWSGTSWLARLLRERYKKGAQGS